MVGGIADTDVTSSYSWSKVLGRPPDGDPLEEGGLGDPPEEGDLGSAKAAPPLFLHQVLVMALLQWKRHLS